MKDARQTAYEILLKIQVENSYSNLALDAALIDSELEVRDIALVSALVYGTLERLITIDYNLSLYLKKPVNKTESEILTVLRLGVCQLLFMDRIPESAAVNESVKLVKQTRRAYASGLVNAVLHKVAKEGLRFPNSDVESIEYLSVKYSCPEWLVLLWIKDYGLIDAVGIMKASLLVPKTIIRVNTTKTSAEKLKSVLEEEGVFSEFSKILKNALILEKAGSIEKLSAFKDGLFHVQDIASQLCCEALCAQPQDTIFDLCSAPGGKTFTLAEIMDGKGQVKAFDIYESRLDLIREGVNRLNLLNVYVSIGNAEIHGENLGFAEKVLCDVPCSGLGIIGRKPEIRYKSKEDIDKLPLLQYFILCNASKYVKVGGLLIYSTCTLNLKENEDVCELFLKNNTNYESRRVLPELINRPINGDYLTLLPHINNSDGFFIALFCRTE
ncbi:MAG: 16S rRNA (cytosine(967)-C(5))-methyltransferase RsmB [Eubacteriales bacterium]